MLHAVVACLPGAAIGFDVVSDFHAFSVLSDYLLAGNVGTVLNYQDFKILEGLGGKALQQFVHLVWAVENGNYY